MRAVSCIALLGVALALVGGADAQVCTGALPPAGACANAARYVSSLPTSRRIRGQYHDWQSKALATIGPKRLAELMWPGSHDAGAFALTAAYGYNPQGVPQDWDKSSSSVTQRFSLLDQLCMGARFFDLRVGKTVTGESKIVHPVGVGALAGPKTNSFFDTWQNSLDQFKCFAEAHPNELLWLRIKFVDFTPQQTVSEAIRIVQFFNGLLVKRSTALAQGERVEQLAQKTYNHVKNTGRIVLMAYVSSADQTQSVTKLLSSPQMMANTVIDDAFWNYPALQDGGYSGANNLKGVQSKQMTKLSNWRATSRGLLHGFWWTATSVAPWVTNLNVNKNTRTLWPKGKRAPDPHTPGAFAPTKNTPLHDARRDADDKCLGNVLVTDFIGDEKRFHWDGVMQIIESTNRQGYCNLRRPQQVPPLNLSAIPNRARSNGGAPPVQRGGPPQPIRGNPVARRNSGPVPPRRN